MSSFEDFIDSAVRNADIPGVMLYARDKSGIMSAGDFKYSHIFGDNLRTGKPLATDDVLTLASVTKLLTSIAALQLVERGILALDDSDVSHHVPALAQKPILTGFSPSGAPIEVPRQQPITLRHLLTHSAGNSYDFLDSATREWQSHHGIKPTRGATVEERFAYPLIYEPGASWAYSSSSDWLGKVIEAVTGQSLEDYMRAHIWDPLGAESFTFRVEKWIDRTTGLCGFFATQMLPAAEGNVRPFIKAFEDEMYARLKRSRPRAAL
ncbi:hypothetical protein K4K57_009053 [Colletotrichum sp. SAR 10_99]